MNKDEFINNKKPLVLLVTFNPVTGETLHDYYDFESASSFKKDFEEDFPDSFTFYKRNKAATRQLKARYGLIEVEEEKDV